MARWAGKDILNRIGSVFIGVLLWFACIASTLLVILLCTVSLKARPEARVFDWIITLIFAAGSVWFWYVTLRRKHRLSAPEYITVDAQGSRRPLARYIIVLGFSTLVFPGLVITLLFAEKNDFITAVSVFLLIFLLPFFGIKMFLEQKSGMDVMPISSPDPMTRDMDEHRTVFLRSGRATAFWFALNGFLLTLFPLWLFLTFVGFFTLFSELSWGAVFFSALGLLMIGLTVWMVAIQYRFFRDRHLPLVVVDDAGVNFRRARSEIIPWSELTSVRLKYARGYPILLLGLQYPERYIDRFNRWYSKELWLGLHILKGPETAVVEAIRSHRLYKGA